MPTEFQKFTPAQYNSFFSSKGYEIQSLIENLPSQDKENFTKVTLQVAGILTSYKSRLKQITRSQPGFKEVAQKAEEDLLILEVKFLVADYRIILERLRAISDQKAKKAEIRWFIKRFKPKLEQKIIDLQKSNLENSEKDLLDKLKWALLEAESLTKKN